MNSLLADPRLGPMVGTVLGAVLGGAVYGLTRGLLPPQFAVGAAFIGLLAGVGARVGKSIGTHAQLRVLIFGSLFAAVVGEYFTFRATSEQADADLFVAHLVADPVWLALTVLFLVTGIFLGTRVLMGGDPVDDVLVHGHDAVPPGATGTPCPRCDSVQTRLDAKTLVLECTECGHQWRV